MRVLVVLGVLAISASAVRAEPRHAEDLVTRPLVLPAGSVEAQLTLEANLQKGRYGRPLSLAPDLWFGLTARWTIGVVHANQSVDRIDAGASFCIHQYASRCDAVYRGGGLEARWSWRTGALAVAPRARLLVRDLDPIKPAVTAGALIRWSHGRFAVTTDPYLRVGLGNRGDGNRDALMIPIWLGIQPTCRWLISLHTGIDGELATWRDGWHVPFALGVRARATSAVDVGFEAGFSSLLGPQNNIKQRAVMVFAAWRR